MEDPSFAERKKTGPNERRPLEQQSAVQLMRSISADTVLLVRKELELARQEITGAATARLKAAGALAAAGVMGLFIMAFLGLAAAAALDGVLRPWASRLVVAAGYLVLAGGAGVFGLMRAKQPPLSPRETKRTVKEDVEWARAQLKR